jgi:pentatricopeptide repeat protein
MMNMFNLTDRPTRALDLLEEMSQRGITPNAVTFVEAAQSCTKLKDLDRAKKIMQWWKDLKIEPTQTLYTAFVQMFGACNDFHTAYALFNEMKTNGLGANSVTYAIMINLCTAEKDFTLGKKLHQEWSKLGMPITRGISSAASALFAAAGVADGHKIPVS